MCTGHSPHAACPPCVLVRPRVFLTLAVFPPFLNALGLGDKQVSVITSCELGGKEGSGLRHFHVHLVCWERELVGGAVCLALLPGLIRGQRCLQPSPRACAELLPQASLWPPAPSGWGFLDSSTTPPPHQQVVFREELSSWANGVGRAGQVMGPYLPPHF